MTSDYLSRHDKEVGSRSFYTKTVRAGKRTYFFDIKATQGNDYFISITESRKVVDKDGNSTFARHNMHLYKEDLDSFMGGLTEAIAAVKAKLQETSSRALDREFDEL